MLRKCFIINHIPVLITLEEQSSESTVFFVKKNKANKVSKFLVFFVIF